MKKKKQKKKITVSGYIANLLSVDEKKASTLIFAFFIILGIVLFKTDLADIPPGWASVISALIYGISGVNAVGMGIGYFGGYQDPTINIQKQEEEGDN